MRDAGYGITGGEIRMDDVKFLFEDPVVIGIDTGNF
jgi:hypothetical protein